MDKKVKSISEASGKGAEILYDDGTSTFVQYADKDLGGNFQYFKNPTTGKVLAGNANIMKSAGQGLSDFLGFVPVSNTDAFAKSVIGVDSAPKVSDGTQGMWDNYNNNVAGIDASINGLTASGESPTSVLDKLRNQLTNINTTTDAELSSIEEAGRAAGAEFDPLIQKAQEARRVTLPQDIVRAGERGGFENTQYAGAAAVLPTRPNEGEAFVGAGGLLDQSRQVLDRNISYLEAEKQRAIAAAKMAQRAAIQSGKRADFQTAMDLVKLGEELQNNIDNRMIQRENLAYNRRQEARQVKADEAAAEQAQYERMYKERQFSFEVDKFNIGEERLNRALDLDEYKFDRQVSQEEEKDALENIKRMAEGQIPLKNIKEKQINEWEKAAGLFPGTFEAYYDKLLTDAKYDKTIDDLKMQQLKADISDKYSAIAKRNADGSSAISKEEKEFYGDVGKAQDELRQGSTWGQSWNSLYLKYRTGDPKQDADLGKVLDDLLDKDVWAKEGAFQTFKASTAKQGEPDKIYNADGSITLIYPDGRTEIKK